MRTHSKPRRPHSTGNSARQRRTVDLLAVLAAATGLLVGCTFPSETTRHLGELSEEVPDNEPGCAAAIHDDDSVAWTAARGIADLEKKRRITDDTLFGIGDTGQQFVATALLLLERDGGIDLDEPIGTHMPELPDWANSVTAKHLLQRTSGIPPYAGFIDENSFYRVTGHDINNAMIGMDGLTLDPGVGFTGQLSDDVLQGFLVEAVDGRPLPQFLTEEGFSVADLDVVVDADPEVPGIATPYAASSGGELPLPDRGSVGDVGIYSTASTLAKWGSQYWEPTVGGDELLRHRTAHMVAETVGGGVSERPPRRGDENGRYGAGVFGQGEGDPGDPNFGIFAPGRDVGFVSDLYVAPDERVAAAVLCNHLAHDPSGMPTDWSAGTSPISDWRGAPRL
jgi:CubicO group peptidase (beta-lactamase class C family)